MIPDCYSGLVKAPYICARVLSSNRNSYVIFDGKTEIEAVLKGSFRYEISSPEDYPLVGDFVEISLPELSDSAMIHSVLPRMNLFSRRAIDGSRFMQPIAANLDRLFIVMSLNRDFNLRRLERYLLAARAYEVPAGVLLSKADLVDDPAAFLESARTVSGEIPVLAMSALSGQGLAQLGEYRGPGRSLALVGSSGVGKSSLLNRLSGSSLLDVSEIRASDDRGRHTSSCRRLVFLSDGTALIDTPGMRELALAEVSSGLEKNFQDLYELAASCRFRNCKHENEPDCAVRESLDLSRLASWRKLEKEAAFVARRSDRLLANEEKKRWKAIMKDARKRKR